VSTPVVQLNPGDTVPLGTILANIHLMGVVTDPSTPNMFAATLEMFGDQGVLTVPVLQGPPGAPGSPQFALAFQNDSLTDPATLPTGLNNTTDVGKYWIFKALDTSGNVVGTTAYIWYGTSYRQMPMGSQGPPGPYPVITPAVTLISPSLSSYIEVSGPASNPAWKLNLAVPAGPTGPSAKLASCPDVNVTQPPVTGQVLGFNGQYNLTGDPVWQPMWIGDIMPGPYTVPESAFTSFTGISTGRQTVCTWQAPAHPWPWQPFIFGALSLHGLDLSINPLQVGAEVRLNDPNSGPLLASALGSTFGALTLIPHTSSSSSPATAMTPTNNYAQVDAGASPKIYVNLVNQGLATVYDFNAANAQLAMLAMPVGISRAAPTTYFGTFGAKIKLTATHSP
jgi:hypothetical protein